MFISFEGGDGSGKSTQARRLKRRLAAQGRRVTLLAEPGGTPLGRRLRRILKYFAGAMAPETEALLFLASRAQLVRESLGPTLARGELVVCDRYADSTLAYQGYGRGLDVAELRRLNDLATGGVYPQLTVLLDLPVEGGSRRLAGRTLDRIEGGEAREHRAEWAFHTRVREGYLALAREEPQRWLLLDASRSRQEVGAAVWDRVRELLEEGR